MLALREAGYAISVPFGENTRYDLVIDGGGLRRVQCKTGRLREGAVRFATCSSYVHHQRPRTPQRDYIGDVDCFAVHYPDTDGVYLIPIGAISTRREGSLRVDPSRNGQRKHIRLAALYEIGRVTSRATQAPRAPSGARGSSA